MRWRSIRFSSGGNEADLNPNVANRNKGPRRQPEKNVFTDEQIEKLEEIFHSSMFNYQRHWWEVGKTNRIRNLLKSRQIGATFYFAREALIDALLTGRNQIFLSASKAQAHVFKQYIIDFAKEVDVELKGDPMVLPNGATLYFLGTNARTAQSYHGNLYLDEYFWIPKFQELRKVASGMAIHKKWRQTYFSTPSSLTHSAYPFWSGALFNRGRNKADKVDIDLSHSNLAPGLLCADGQYRHPLLSQQAFSRFVQDYLVFGNAYLEKRTNRFGEVIALEPALAKYTRRGLDLDTYWFVQYGMTTQPYQFTKGSIFHLMEPDINQEIYGLPGYLSAIPSALLNESATLFRRKYYINGSHAGFIMYMTDAAQNQEDVNNLRNAMKSAKGPGNFRNLFMYSPNGKKDGLQIIPLSEVAAKDEFLNIKNVSRDDMMAAHRVPPQMMGIMPNNVGGFGDVEKASKVFVRNELLPLQKRLQEINNFIKEGVIEFQEYHF
ncbi:phage portal protein [Escherichia coli]|nr:phage portal protein [Escherichia coli]